MPDAPSPPSTSSPRSPGPPEREKPPRVERRSWQALTLIMLLLSAIWVWRASPTGSSHPRVDYSVFYGWAEEGKVKSVVLSPTTVRGELRAAEAVGGNRLESFETVVPDADPALLPLLREKKVAIAVSDPANSLALDALLTMLPWVAIFGFWWWSARRARTLMGRTPLAGMLESKSRRFEKSTSVNVCFDDVAGLGSAKRDLMEVIDFLKEPGRFRRLGGKVPRGILLVGPPGTGKTLLARAVAGESGVPFFSISASEFIEMFVGVGAARVRDLFAEAKKAGPAIIFIDELDAVGRSRGAGFGGGHDEREQTLNQLLSEMDGFDRNDLTVVLAATNRPDVLDPALLRPGRFDRRVIVDRPELEARRAILRVHVKNKPLGKDVDLDAIAKRAPGFSGADLANLVNEAALHATRRGAEAVEAIDFAEAHDKIVLGDPREAKLRPDEARRVAVHESGHAIVAQFSPGSDLPERVTIIPRGVALGATLQTPSEDRHIMTEPQLRARLRVLLGGYAAERLIFGHVSTGAENDLKQATQLASKMVAHYGMSSSLGPAYYEHDIEHPFLGQRIATDGGVSDATAHAIERETRDTLSNALAEATHVLAHHRRSLERLSQILTDRETLEAAELQGLIGTAADRDRPEVAAGAVATG